LEHAWFVGLETATILDTPFGVMKSIRSQKHKFLLTGVDADANRTRDLRREKGGYRLIAEFVGDAAFADRSV
jgi:hypothetical protein